MLVFEIGQRRIGRSVVELEDCKKVSPHMLEPFKTRVPNMHVKNVGDDLCFGVVCVDRDGRRLPHASTAW